MSRTPIPHPVLITVAVTVFSVAVSVGVTELVMAASGSPFVPIALYLSGGLPAFAVPFTVYPLLRIINRQRELRAELERLVGTDVLTELPNRRAFFEKAAAILARPARHETPVTAMMIDVDRFKSINDNGGHRVGDDVLVAAAGTIRDVVAESGSPDWTVARVGGDEFAVLVSGLVPSAVARLAERICREARGIGERRGEVATTVSVGVAFRAEGMDIDSLLQRADAAAYVAKRSGRDRWVFASGDVEKPADASAAAIRATYAAAN